MFPDSKPFRNFAEIFFDFKNNFYQKYVSRPCTIFLNYSDIFLILIKILKFFPSDSSVFGTISALFSQKFSTLESNFDT